MDIMVEVRHGALKKLSSRDLRELLKIVKIELELRGERSGNK